VFLHMGDGGMVGFGDLCDRDQVELERHSGEVLGIQDKCSR
jgi:hypothetical protein